MRQRNERLIRARGFRTQEAVARAVQRRCPGHRTKDGEMRPCAFGREQLSRAECGAREHLSLEHVRLLCEEYDRNAVALGLLDEDMLRVLSGQATESGDSATTGVQAADEQREKVITTHRRTFLRSVGVLPVLPAAAAAFPQEVAYAIDQARQVQTNGTLSQAVEGLSTETRFLVSAYESADIDVLEPEIADLVTRIDDVLIEGPRVRDRMELYFDLAQLYAIRSDIHVTRGLFSNTRVYAGTLRTYAREIGHRDLEAWSFVLVSSADKYEGRYTHAISNARRAYEVADSDAFRAKAASRALARAYAYAGNRSGLEEAVRFAELADSRTADDQALGGVFSLDRADVPMYNGNALVLAGLEAGDKAMLQRARENCERGLQILADRGEWPREQAEIKLDTASALVRLGEPERALSLAENGLRQEGPGRTMMSRLEVFMGQLPQPLRTDFSGLAQAWSRRELTSV